MHLIPIYLNPAPSPNDLREAARITAHWLGVPRTVVFCSPPPSSRHSFDAMRGHAHHYGFVLAPEGSCLAPGARGWLLIVPTPDGELARLSAADVAEQASVGGCGLGWASGKPDAWMEVRSATPREAS